MINESLKDLTGRRICKLILDYGRIEYLYYSFGGLKEKWFESWSTDELNQTDCPETQLINSFEILEDTKNVLGETYYHFLIKVDRNVFLKNNTAADWEMDRLKKVTLISESGASTDLDVLNDHMIATPSILPEVDEDNENTGYYIIRFYGAIKDRRIETDV